MEVMTILHCILLYLQRVLLLSHFLLTEGYDGITVTNGDDEHDACSDALF